MSLLRCVLFLGLLGAAAAQDPSAPSPAPPPGVRIEFAPPPMEGVISLGIYDAGGKLVRVLHREAPIADFKIGVNGLITRWDGKDDSGAQAPAGKYSGRGYMVGELSVEGEAFLFNDWVSGEGDFRPRRIRSVNASKEGGLVFTADSAAGGVSFSCDLAGKVLWSKPLPEAAVAATPALPGHTALSGSAQAVDSSLSSDGNEWLIVRDGGGVEVREYTPAGEFVRRLAVKAGEPVPVKISATGPANEIFLLEQDDAGQRVRGLELAAAQPAAVPGQPAISTWKVIFSKSILFSDPFPLVRDLLKDADGKPFVAQEKVKLRLVANPLDPNQVATLMAGVAVDKQGSFLRLPDGLPLRHLTETPGLRWAVLGSGSHGISLFQSDGAVVEEFKVSRLEDMMAFDCGSFDYSPGKE